MTEYDKPDAGMTRDQEFEHLLFHPGVSAMERPVLLRAWQAGRDFRDAMNTLLAEPGAGGEEVRLIQWNLMRIVDQERRRSAEHEGLETAFLVAIENHKMHRPRLYRGADGIYRCPECDPPGLWWWLVARLGSLAGWVKRRRR